MKNRNVNVEWMRIVCILLVILTHVLNRNYVDGNGNIRDKVCLLNTICIVAVPCFFMITGFFSRKGQNGLRRIGTTLKKIVLPGIVVAVVIQIYFAFRRNGVSLETVTAIDWTEILRKIISWNINKLEGVSPLWYVTDYFKLMLLFPVLSLLCCEEKEAVLARRVVYILYILNAIVGDVRTIYPLSIRIQPPIDRTVFFFLIGYEFNNISPEKMFRSRWYFGVSAVTGCLLMYAWTLIINRETGEFNDYFFHYQTLPCIIASVGAFGFLKNWKLPEVEWMQNLIVAGGSLTFGVFLIHNIVLIELRDHSVFSQLKSLEGLLLLWFCTAVISFFLVGIWKKLVVKKGN